MRQRNASCFRAAIIGCLLCAGSAYAATSPTSGVTIVHTNGLGALLTGVSKADGATTAVISKKLEELRSKYSKAIFVDSGNMIGPMVYRDTQFTIPTFRLFHKLDYSAVAPSTRDALHTFSLFLLFPPPRFGAPPEVPIVTTFKHVRDPTPTNPFRKIVPASSTAERGGARLQFFGVCSTKGITAFPKPFQNAETMGSVATQAGYVLDNLEEGHLPVILSDLTPAENDELAKVLNRNALVFEGSYPWLLARPPRKQKRSRTIGPVKIVSHYSPGEADVVVLPAGLKCAAAKLETEPVWALKEPKSGGEGIIGRLFAKKPLEAKVVDNWFTDTFYLPDIGSMLIKEMEAGSAVPWERLLQELLIPFRKDEVQRTPPKDMAGWKPPRWMVESRHLRGNETIFRYELFFNGEHMARVYRVTHYLVPGLTVFNMLVAVDSDHRIKKVKMILAPTVAGGLKVSGEAITKLLKGKRFDEIRLEDWPERGGAEYIIDNIVRDIQLLLAWDEEYG